MKKINLLEAFELHGVMSKFLHRKYSYDELDQLIVDMTDAMLQDDFGTGWYEKIIAILFDENPEDLLSDVNFPVNLRMALFENRIVDLFVFCESLGLSNGS